MNNDATIRKKWLFAQWKCLCQWLLAIIPATMMSNPMKMRIIPPHGRFTWYSSGANALKPMRIIMAPMARAAKAPFLLWYSW